MPLQLSSLRRLALCLAVAGLLLAAPARAQQQNEAAPPSEVPPSNVPAYAPLDLLAPNDYRAASGNPGADYWQQRADYQIEVRLDTTNHRVTGTETITYTNDSPQPLDYLWVQLEQNLFRPGSRGALIVPSEARFSGAFEAGGYTLSNVALTRGGERRLPEYLVNDTRLRITLDEPLPPGETLDLSMDFAFTVPPYGADRMGRYEAARGTVYEIAQWYPRMYVFDDVSGWNTLPYLGQGEFYLEYGTFDVAITVPHGMIVAATGTLQNPDEVLTEEQRGRLDEARQSQETVMIIGPDEVGDPSTRPDGEGPLTWRFHAEDVHDVAWAASPAFIWDAARIETGADPALAQSFYPHEGLGGGEAVGWEESTQMVQHSIAFYSDFLAPYPYPVAINVAGIVGGMEYPQIVFCSVEARGEALFGVTDHEFGHEWFPMIVGSNERRHAWMDEGLNTFINLYSSTAYYNLDTTEVRTAFARRIAQVMASDVTDQPIMTYADRIRREDLGFLAYRKPGAGLFLLREYLLGPERFDSAFHQYIRRWAYKHPQPADFFRTIEDVAGEDLDWFWRGWFMTTDELDQAVAGVEATEEGTLITVENRAELLMPVVMQVTRADDSTELLRVPVEAFFNSDAYVVAVPGAEITSVVIDPEGLLPDVERGNNTWSAGGSDAAAPGEE